jgi:hypothetical protein
MRKAALFAMFVFALVVTSTAATAFAETTYTILIQDPNNPANGAYGLSMSGGHWVGQIPITITGGSTSTQTMAYCMQAERLIYIGSSYSATLATTPDTASWRAVSYVLSWDAPNSDNAAAISQVAIWKILNSSYACESWMDMNVYNQGVVVAAIANGKDVVRQGDNFNWIAPITSDGATTKGNPGQAITFVAQLTDSAHQPRANVKIQFSAQIDGTQLNSTYISASETYTASQGIVQVTVTVPSDTPLGSTVTVQASTQSIWPQRYIDLTSSANQDLIGMSETLNLTLATNVCILAYIMVVPESAWGALSGIVAFAAAFVIYTQTHKIRQNH